MCALIFLWKESSELRPNRELYMHMCAHLFSMQVNLVASWRLPTHYTMTGTLMQKDGHCDNLKQGCSNLAREIHFPAELSSNPNQTHLSMLIHVFRIIRKSKVGEFDQGWSETLQESGSREPDLSITALKWWKYGAMY